MSITKCKECCKELAKNLKSCPHCGCPIKCTNAKKIVIILVIVISLLIVTISSILIKTTKSNIVNNVYGNEIFNLTSYTDNFIQYGDWLIFSNGVSTVLNKTVNNYDEGIYKYNTVTGQVVKLSDYDGGCFNLIGNSLFYVSKFNSINYINLDSLKSSTISWINNENYKATDLLICDGYLYYRESNGQNLYRTTVSGQSKKLVAEYTKGNFQIYDNFIYYIDANFNTLKKKSCVLDDSPIQIVDEKISNFYFKDNKIIYTVGNDLKILNMTDNSINTIKNGITSNFIIHNNNIYMYISESKRIISLNLEDKSEDVILDNIDKDITRLQFFDNNLYYSNRQVNMLWSSYATTTLYYVNINDKIQQTLQFKT